MQEQNYADKLRCLQYWQDLGYIESVVTTVEFTTWRLTAQGLQALGARFVCNSFERALEPRAGVAVHDSTTWELDTLLKRDGWEHVQLAVGVPVPAPYDSRIQDCPKCWYSRSGRKLTAF